MPVINDNSFAQGQAAGTNVAQAFTGAYATSAQFAIALKRMQAVEKQFKQQLKMQQANFQLREEQFAAQQELNAIKIEQMKFETEAAKEEQKQVGELQEVLPQIGSAAAAYFRAAATGDAEKAFKELERGFKIGSKSPKAFSMVSGLFQGQGRMAEAFIRANKPADAGKLPTDVDAFTDTLSFIADRANTVAGAGERERNQLAEQRKAVLRQATDRLRLAEAVSTVEFMGTVDPASLTGGSAAIGQALAKLQKEMQAKQAEGQLQQVKLMGEAQTLLVQEVGRLDRERDKLAVKQRVTDRLISDRIVDTGLLEGKTTQQIAAIGLLEAKSDATNTVTATMQRVGKVVDMLYQQMDADPQLKQAMHSVKYDDLQAADSTVWEELMGHINARVPANIDAGITQMVVRAYIEQMGGVPRTKPSTKQITEESRREHGFINLDY